MPTNPEIAALVLAEENAIRFLSFTTNDAVTLGLSLRKRFKASSRYQKYGRGLLISIKTIAGQTLFACTVGDTRTGCGDISLQRWERLDAMTEIVKRTGHSSHYSQLRAGCKHPSLGGGFPVWLQNVSCCPVAVVSICGGVPVEDHKLVQHTLSPLASCIHSKPTSSQSILDFVSQQRGM